MAYPEEIIIQLTEKFKLTHPQQQQLHESLMVEEVHAAINAGTFDSANLLIQLKMPNGETYISILSPTIARRIITDPAQLAELIGVMMSNPLAVKEWDSVKMEIKRLSQLPSSKLREKKETGKKLSSRLTSLSGFIEGSSLLLREHFIVSQALFQYMNVLVEPIEIAAKKYFKSFFGEHGITITDDNITFTPKHSGVQLGTTMAIAYKDSEAKEHRITYYVKTHQHGSTSETSSVKPPDPKELFVYKVLEYVGYGPKTHFFFNLLSPGGFFIATQDMAFTKVMSKEKSFMPFERFAESYNTTPAAPQYEEARQALIGLDILSRVLRLSDTTTNPGNFGLVTVNRERSKWKFLDFRINSEPDVTYSRKEIFEDFCEGNGVYNYDYANFLRYIFKDPTYESSKMHIAQQTMDELHNGKPSLSRESRKMSLPAAMERAFHEITEYVTSNRDALRIDLDAALADLRKYFAAAQENFKVLGEGIHKKCAAPTAEPHGDTTICGLP